MICENRVVLSWFGSKSSGLSFFSALVLLKEHKISRKREWDFSLPDRSNATESFFQILFFIFLFFKLESIKWVHMSHLTKFVKI